MLRICSVLPSSITRSAWVASPWENSSSSTLLAAGAAREKFTPRDVSELPMGHGLPRWMVAKAPARGTQDALLTR